jgi:hypothetical protein
LHSTYSESSSRDTICTRGCLHGGFGTFAAVEGDGMEVINPVYWRPAREGEGKSPEIGRIFSLVGAVVKSLSHGVYFPFNALIYPFGLETQQLPVTGCVL